MIPLGKLECSGCGGVGQPAGDPWARCRSCDGVGHVWAAGGPAFGATITLADRDPGDVVELAIGRRARILWHMPRKNPESTFVALFDDFDGTEDHTPVPSDSRLGISAVIASRQMGRRADICEGEKDADAVDPIASRRRAGGPLL